MCCIYRALCRSKCAKHTSLTVFTWSTCKQKGHNGASDAHCTLRVQLPTQTASLENSAERKEKGRCMYTLNVMLNRPEVQPVWRV